MSISAIIIDHLLQLQRGDVRKLVSYWFIDDISTDASELEPMLRSLIRQLIPVPNVVPAFVREAVQNHRQAGSFLKIDELSQLVCRLVNESDRDVYMVIDGFDRTLESLLSPRRKLLLDLILNLQQSNNGNLHLLVSAKHDADICQALQHIGVCTCSCRVRFPGFLRFTQLCCLSHQTYDITTTTFQRARSSFA
jgi:hypothetical protein